MVLSIKKLYYWLGLSAVIIALASTIASITLYILGYGVEYLLYTIVWLIVSLIDYILWKKPPIVSGSNSMTLEKDYCGILREVVELVMILYTLSSGKDVDYSVITRYSNVLSRIDLYRGCVLEKCSFETESLLARVLSGDTDGKTIAKLLELLDKCLVLNGCTSNIEYVRE